MQRAPKYRKMLIAPIDCTEKFHYAACPKMLPPTPHRGPPSIHPSIHPSLQALYPCPEAFDDVTDMAHFVKFSLEVVNLAQDVSEAGDFSIGGSNRGLGAGRLVEGGALGLRCEVIDPALDRSH